ncbi:hypothetical protein YZ43_01120 [Campylobacter upsaliensis]|nr:hypothetical protein [Campylobacter upsaliensis]
MRKMIRLYASAIALGALLLTGCGDSMSDTHLKDYNYYKAHKEEAVTKAKWCFEEADISNEEIQSAIQEAKKSERMILYITASLKLRFKEMKFSNIDTENCYQATRIFFGVENSK